MYEHADGNEEIPQVTTKRSESNYTANLEVAQLSVRSNYCQFSIL